MKQNNVTLFGANEPLLIAINTLKKRININNIISNNNNLSVKNFCNKNKINFLNDIDFIKMELTNKYKLNKSDFALSFSYRNKISINTIKYFDNKIYNFHPANLPFYRGNLPTVWPIINDDDYAYYTLHVLNGKFDQGPIIAKSKIKIYKKDTGISLYNRLVKKLPRFINENLCSLTSNRIKIMYQNEKIANFYSSELPNKGFISLDWEGMYIERYVRALYSDKHIPALIYYNDKYLKIYKVKHLKNLPTNLNKKNLILKCNDGYIKVIEYEKK